MKENKKNNAIKESKNFRVTNRKFLLIFCFAVILFSICAFFWKYAASYTKIIMVCVSLIVLGVFTWIVFMWKSNKIPNYKFDKYLCKEDFERICNARELWKISQGLWNSVHVLLVVTSIFFTLFVIYISGSKEYSHIAQDVIFYSILSLVLTIIDLLINPIDIARSHRKAFEKINYGLFLYRNNHIDAKRLIDMVAECENFLQDNVL